MTSALSPLKVSHNDKYHVTRKGNQIKYQKPYNISNSWQLSNLLVDSGHETQEQLIMVITPEMAIDNFEWFYCTVSLISSAKSSLFHARIYWYCVLFSTKFTPRCKEIRAKTVSQRSWKVSRTDGNVSQRYNWFRDTLSWLWSLTVPS